MKKKILALLTVTLTLFSAVNAQDAPPPRQTLEERTKSTMEKLSVLALTADAQKKTEAVFLDFYTAQQKYMDEVRASGTMDREAMRAKREELSKARDERLKTILTAEQLKKWSEEIEPSLRPQRRN